MGGKRIVIKAGDKFGSWVADGSFCRIKHNSMWGCVCVCGTHRMVAGATLISGQSQSCGCVLRAKIKQVTESKPCPKCGGPRVRVKSGAKTAVVCKQCSKNLHRNLREAKKEQYRAKELAYLESRKWVEHQKKRAPAKAKLTKEINDKSLETARNNYAIWTKRQTDIVMTRQYPDIEIAVMIGRTVRAIRHQRSKMNAASNNIDLLRDTNKFQ